MHNHHTFVRCPDSFFSWYSLVWYILWWLYPSLIHGVTENSGILLKIQSPFWLWRNLCRCRFFDYIFKEDEGAPLSQRGGASLMKASPCPPSASRPFLKENFPSTFSWGAVAFLGMLQRRGEATPVAASRSVRTIFPVFLQNPVLIIEMRYFIFQLLIKVSIIHFFQNL
jgi:hypothetical protein